jgi:hypothetical protein
VGVVQEGVRERSARVKRDAVSRVLSGARGAAEGAGEGTLRVSSGWEEGTRSTKRCRCFRFTGGPTVAAWYTDMDLNWTGKGLTGWPVGR